ncbi:hypothetical protein KEM56_007116, partial [Ascosphaera pollenicola]
RGQSVEFDGKDFIIWPFHCDVSLNKKETSLHWALLLGSRLQGGEMEFLCLNSYAQGWTPDSGINPVAPTVTQPARTREKPPGLKQLLQACLQKGVRGTKVNLQLKVADAFNIIMQPSNSNDCALHVLAHIEAFLSFFSYDQSFANFFTDDEEGSWKSKMVIRPLDEWKVVFLEFFTDIMEKPHKLKDAIFLVELSLPLIVKQKEWS